MENWAWIWWTIFGVLLIIAEIFTTGFFLLWFGVGALAASLLALLGFGIGWQFVAFAFISILLTALSRNIFIKYFAHQDDFKSGVDALPGQIGIVVGASRGAMKAGEVKVFGTTWTAYPTSGEESLAEGERVEITSVQGASVFVKKIDALPEWRQSALVKSDENDG